MNIVAYLGLANATPAGWPDQEPGHDERCGRSRVGAVPALTTYSAARAYTAIRGRVALRGCLAIAAALALATASHAATWKQDDAAIAACFSAMDADPALSTVNAKFARRDPSPAQLADTSVATEAEANELRLRIAKTRPCREMRLAAVHAHRRSLEPAYKTLYYQSDQVFDYLTQGFITYGTANRLAAEALSAFKNREAVYLKASRAKRIASAAAWDEALQRAHSNPPPDSGPRTCTWEDLNLTCAQ